ncbi:hypothetical protein F3Y22_tig00110462pilonHSYRG00374 [Hibiscus syriacus]|uniref:Uncharacterized protein n=1 Tax=Hibiscus syriacus TaxID=106335 RepID=A0A6A3AH82_HIBSY|nr:hypothetical protein F3Y22_tig00110462pilonHSYRG00374 [Hibiscus syriacus]
MDGVECDYDTGHVIGLDLGSSFLYGSIDSISSLFQLHNLTRLNLSDNDFNGSEIPYAIGNLNQIPYRFGNLTRLTILDLGSNGFWCTPVPQSVFTPTKLEFLDLVNNYLSGTYNLGSFLNLTNLKVLELSGNKFSLVTTPVMSAIVPKFIVLTLGSCNLIEFPDFLMGFHQPAVVPPWTNLRVLELSSNNLQGSLPVPPASIYHYSVSNNLLTGEISSMICKLSSISVIDLSNNSFSGTLPPCLGTLSKSLSVLNLQNNNFRGPIPQACEKGSKLREIDLSQNHGLIPTSLANCNMLEFLNLGNKQFEDTFPSLLGKLQQLKVIILRHNGFHGAIGKPKSNEFPRLRIFDLSFNKFEGGLPSHHFRRWKAMKVVDLGN